jgi:FkbM family methyltransferase
VTVYAFEPFSSNFAWLRKNIEGSGLANVRIFQQAVAGSPGQQPLFIDPVNCMFHSLVRDYSKDGSKRPCETVECTTLDEIFAVHGIASCHLLKLDCEGAEVVILENTSPESLNKVRKVVGEYHGDETAAALGRLLEARGFHVEYSHAGIFRARNTVPLAA